jgi:hypothetical protein
MPSYPQYNADLQFCTCNLQRFCAALTFGRIEKPRRSAVKTQGGLPFVAGRSTAVIYDVLYL